MFTWLHTEGEYCEAQTTIHMRECLPMPIVINIYNLLLYGKPALLDVMKTLCASLCVSVRPGLPAKGDC